MEFAKYYDVTSIVTKMIENGELDAYTLGRPLLRGAYICEDTNDFWICRVMQGLNAEYEPNTGKFLIERDRVHIADVMDKLYEMYGMEMGMEEPAYEPGRPTFEMKNKIHDYIDKFTTRNIIRAALLMDNELELPQWDCWDTDTLDEAISDIDGGYGILVA